MDAVDTAIVGKEGSASAGAAETTEGAVFAAGGVSQPPMTNALGMERSETNVRQRMSIETRIREAGIKTQSGLTSVLALPVVDAPTHQR
jgi:hypothetical protein